MSEKLYHIVTDLEALQDRLQKVVANNETAEKFIDCAGSTIDAVKLVLHIAIDENRN